MELQVKQFRIQKELKVNNVTERDVAYLLAGRQTGTQSTYLKQGNTPINKERSDLHGTSSGNHNGTYTETLKL
jgi:hypothetical protein